MEDVLLSDAEILRQMDEHIAKHGADSPFAPASVPTMTEAIMDLRRQECTTAEDVPDWVLTKRQRVEREQPSLYIVEVPQLSEAQAEALLLAGMVPKTLYTLAEYKSR